MKSTRPLATPEGGERTPVVFLGHRANGRAIHPEDLLNFTPSRRRRSVLRRRCDQSEALAVSEPLRLTRVKITPELAREYLTRNTNNRPVRRAAVDRHKRDMLADGYAYNPVDAIAFGSNGDLLNGQHRLIAVIESGVTIECDVIFGVDPELMKVLDSGDRRHVRDHLCLGYGINLSAMEVATLHALMYQARLVKSGRRRTPREMADAWLRWGVSVRHICSKVAACRTGQRAAPAPVRACLVRATPSLGPNIIDDFMRCLLTGAYPQDEADRYTGPILLHQFLTLRTRPASGGNMSSRFQQEAYLKTARALLAFKSGDKLTILRAVATDPFADQHSVDEG